MLQFAISIFKYQVFLPTYVSSRTKWDTSGYRVLELSIPAFGNLEVLQLYHFPNVLILFK